MDPEEGGGGGGGGVHVGYMNQPIRNHAVTNNIGKQFCQLSKQFSNFGWNKSFHKIWIFLQKLEACFCLAIWDVYRCPTLWVWGQFTGALNHKYRKISKLITHDGNFPLDLYTCLSHLECFLLKYAYYFSLNLAAFGMKSMYMKGLFLSYLADMFHFPGVMFISTKENIIYKQLPWHH